MAIKLKTLSSAPANFPLTVTVKDLSGEDVEIGFTAIGRTLREWHPIYIKRLSEEANASIEALEKADAEAEAEASKEPDAAKPKKKRKPIQYQAAEAEASIETALQRGLALVREFAVGWDLDVEFSDDAIKNLIAQFPSVQQEAHQKYHQAILGNRAKN